LRDPAERGVLPADEHAGVQHHRTGRRFTTSSTSCLSGNS
jgi:hypothetical protein